MTDFRHNALLDKDFENFDKIYLAIKKQQQINVSSGPVVKNKYEQMSLFNDIKQKYYFNERHGRKTYYKKII